MIPSQFDGGIGMRRFVEGVDRQQSTLFPECVEDWICEDNPVRVIDVFVGGLDLAALEFGGVDPEATGRPSYHPSVLLKLYVYGYLNRVQSSRRLEREAGRNCRGHVANGPAGSRSQNGCGFPQGQRACDPQV
jgi:transposase